MPLGTQLNSACSVVYSGVIPVQEKGRTLAVEVQDWSHTDVNESRATLRRETPRGVCPKKSDLFIAAQRSCALKRQKQMCHMCITAQQTI